MFFCLEIGSLPVLLMLLLQQALTCRHFQKASKIWTPKSYKLCLINGPQSITDGMNKYCRVVMGKVLSKYLVMVF